MAAAVRSVSAPSAFALGDPSSVHDSQVLVVGGGFSGVGAATALVEAGVDVLLAEQGRGVGGRVTTRHVRGSSLTFDHGAQYFAPRAGSRFHALVRELELEGVLSRWSEGRLGTLTSDGGVLRAASFQPWEDSKTAWVGLPGMSAVGRALLARAAAAPGAGRLTVAAGTRVAPGSLRRVDGVWLADTHPKPSPEAARTTRHRVVLACGSASSTFNVISPTAPELAAAAAAVQAKPCWALMVAFASPLFPARAWDGAMVEGGDIAWLACDSSKPGRAAGAGETWVVHAAPHFDTATAIPAAGGGGGDAAAAGLLATLLRAAGVDAAAAPPVLYLESFRWNAAFPLNPASQPCYVDGAAGLGLCGDWCIGPRAGDAWESGQAAARALLAAQSAGELDLGSVV